MNHQVFSNGEAINHGWELTKKNFWFMAGLLLFIMLLSVGSGVIPPISFLVGIFSSISLLTAALDLSSGKEVGTKDLFKKYHVVLKYLLASVMYGALVLVGLILFIAPGIYFALKYQFYKFIILEREINPLEALRESSRITHGLLWQLFGFFWILIGINVLGMLALGVGLFLSIPTTLFAIVFVYRKLLAEEHHSTVAS